MDKASVVENIEKIVADAISGSELELVHVEVAGHGPGTTVRIFIDKPGGVQLDDCSDLSHRVGQVLDEQDVVPSAYTLEVSSPGLERELYSLKDFEKFAGSLAKMKTRAPIGGQRNFKGRIKAVDGETVVFEDKTAGEVRIEYSLVSKANLEIDIEEEFRRYGKQDNK
jgi:ribosome maturation factor RimP